MATGDAITLDGTGHQVFGPATPGAHDSTKHSVTYATSAALTGHTGSAAVHGTGLPVAAIADLNLGTLTLLTDVITALGTVQTKLNTLLAELRTAGILHT